MAGWTRTVTKTITEPLRVALWPFLDLITYLHEQGHIVIKADRETLMDQVEYWYDREHDE